MGSTESLREHQTIDKCDCKRGYSVIEVGYMITVKKTKGTEITTNYILNWDRNYLKRLFEMLMVFKVIKPDGWLEPSVTKMSS